jgi:hypothetical protein
VAPLPLQARPGRRLRDSLGRGSVGSVGHCRGGSRHTIASTSSRGAGVPCRDAVSARRVRSPARAQLRSAAEPTQPARSGSLTGSPQPKFSHAQRRLHIHWVLREKQQDHPCATFVAKTHARQQHLGSSRDRVGSGRWRSQQWTRSGCSLLSNTNVSRHPLPGPGPDDDHGTRAPLRNGVLDLESVRGQGIAVRMEATTSGADAESTPSVSGASRLSEGAICTDIYGSAAGERGVLKCL